MSEEVGEKPQLEFDGFLPEQEVKPGYMLEKHRSIIHRSHLPTAVAEKAFNAFMIVAKVTCKEKQWPKERYMTEGFSTNARFIMKMSGAQTKNRTYFVAAMDALQRNVLKFDFFHQDPKFDGGEGVKELRSFAPISEIRYLPHNDEIKFFLPPTLIDLVTNPDTYDIIDTKIAGVLTSVYAIAIYELGQVHMGETVSFTPEEFRSYMGLKPDEYTKTSDLRRYVLEKGCEEVIFKCDMRVDYHLVKVGKGGKVVAVELTFSPALNIIEVPEDLEQLELVAKFCELLPFDLQGQPWVVSDLKKALDEHGEEWVLSNVEAFVQKMSQGRPKNPMSLFRKTFQEDRGKEIRQARAVEEIMERNRQSKTVGGKNIGVAAGEE